MTQPIPRPRPTPLAVATLGLAMALTGSAPAQDGPRVDDTRAAMQKWVETRRIISAEQRDWALGREMLEDRLELVQNEIESLRARIDEAQESIAEADKKRDELIEENERLKSAASTLQDTVTSLEQRTGGLLATLPEPIQERVEPLSQRFPEDPDDTQLSLSERFQNVVGILNQVNKFHRDISVTSEVRALPDGTTTEVTALYLGIGQAYYTNTNGTAAGVGRPSPEGWSWTPANEHAEAIRLAVAILEGEQGAAFVRLPVVLEENEE